MSTKVSSHCWETSRADSDTLLVLLAIADYADNEGEAYPSIATLAAKSRSSERNVFRCIGRLVDLGELRVESGQGPKGRNLYRVPLTNCHPDRLSPLTTDAFPYIEELSIEGSPKPPKKTTTVRVEFLDGKFSIPARISDSWKSAYPGIDYATEVAKAEVWLVANPKKRPTPGGMGRFLNAWMLRAGSARVGQRDAKPRTSVERTEAFFQQLNGGR